MIELTNGQAANLTHDTCRRDPELAAVMGAWQSLPAAFRAGIMAMVKAASETRRNRRDEARLS